MHLICAYCGRYIKEKKPFEITKKTHGICRDCLMPLMSQSKELSSDDYVETFDIPVVVVDSRRRIAAANQAALEMMGKSIEHAQGLLAGEALQCRYSRLPEGCGKTIHCQMCTIRNLVLKTTEQRDSHYNEPVAVETEEGRISFLVSTVFCDGLVQIMFEECPPDKG